LKLAIISNEFFDAAHGRFGGFGWATQQVATLFQSKPECGIDIVYIDGQQKEKLPDQELIVRGTPVIQHDGDKKRLKARLQSEQVDLFLLIDYRPTYNLPLSLLPKIPLILWARDPRTPVDEKRVLDIRMPNYNGQPGGLQTPCCHKFNKIYLWAKLTRRKIAIATPSDFLKKKIPLTYNLKKPKVVILPNIINMRPEPIQKATSPEVVFLGRLDPYKRPWLYEELAKRIPEAKFFMMGKAHFAPPSGYQLPEIMPKNLISLGHQNEEEKQQGLKRAWLLVNTSVHEGLAVSFQEALRCETPVISSVNPENVASRFGHYVGDFTGSGLESLDAFERAIRNLIENDKKRLQLGIKGREWVQATHSEETFLRAFEAILSSLKIPHKLLP
jgi:glycosyltransferase involved in cell wall biosynthesis